MNEINIDRIKQVVESDDYNKTYLRRFLDLIILIDKNYKHIIQLETLTELLKGGLTSYMKEYRPEIEFLAKECGKAADNTFSNHYKAEDEAHYYDAYSLYEDFIGECSIISYKKELRELQK